MTETCTKPHRKRKELTEKGRQEGREKGRAAGTSFTHHFVTV